MKVYDCFTFYNEFELLEWRLAALWDTVSLFVIVEANRKHNGEPKDFTFPKRAEEFKRFWPKIRYIKADLLNVPFKGTGDWSIEIAQRNMILRGIDDAEPDDLIFISDIDEFPAPDILQRLQENKVALMAPAVLPITVADKGQTFPARLLVPAAHFLEFGAIVMQQKPFFYYLDLWCSNGAQQCTILTKRKNFTMPQELRNLKDNLLPRVLDGGYHLSYMGGVDRVITKMNSIVEGYEIVAKSNEYLLDRNYIEKSLANGTDIFVKHRAHKQNLIPFDVRNINLPHLEEFLRKYPHFLREPEKYFGK